MQAGSKNLQKVFEQTVRYRIPLFQRPYVWKQEENWEPLWQDIRNLADRQVTGSDGRSHFIGAVVLEQLLGATGAVEVRQVIDGQQRLITIQILLAALRDIARAQSLDKYYQRCAKYTANDEAFIGSKEELFKVWPTNLDRSEFQTTMTAGSPDELRRLYGKKKTQAIGIKIPDAYLYFHGVVQEWMGSDPAELEKRSEALWNSITTQLRVVTIDLEQDDDPQVIFETLNALGTKLLPADLVKNYLFHLAELKKLPLDELYEKYWKFFDDNFWREEVRQGRLKRPRLDLFFQHYLTLKTNDDVNVTHIFEVFKGYDKSSGKSVEEHLKDLKEYGDLSRTFFSPPKGSRAELFFYRLDLIDTATVIPLLLEAFRAFPLPDGEAEIAQILMDMESFLARRMVCNLTTKNYNRFFLDVLKDAAKAGGVSPQQFRSYLLKQTAEVSRWPDDGEFGKALLTSQLYDILSQRKLRMILEALDLAMESEKSEKIYIQASLSIEHLLPQSWHEYWPLNITDPEEKKRASERRDSILHTIGNLTLLTQKLNSSVSKGPWETKKPAIVAQSKLNMNRRFHDIPDWNEDRIQTRSQQLLDLAKSVWPRPSA